MVESPRSPGVDLGAPAEPQVVRILVKSPWQKEEFLLHTDTSVREFKAHVARQFSRSPASFSSASADHVALVYAGRLLKDGRTLRQHGLHLDQEATVHAVLRAPPPPRGPPARHDDRLGELTASLGLKTATFAEFQSQLLSNPEAMLQLLESPSIQRKLSCPGLVRELVSESPPVRQALQQSAPEIGRFLGSPEGLSLVVQLARNPAAVREILAAAPPARGPPGCRLGNAPSSGDHHHGARPEALAGLLGLAEKAVRNNRTGSPLGPEPSSGPQAPLDGGEHRLPSAKGCPPKPGPQNAASGVREHSQEESQGASAAVRNLLHQIMKHLLQSMAAGGPRRPSGPGPCAPAVSPTSRRRAPGHASPREEEGQQQQQTTTTDSTEALLAQGTPSELRGLLEIQRRLRALVAEDAPAERRGRPERPARRAHSITSLCDLVLPAGGGGGSSLHLSAQQLLPARLGSGLVVAGDQGASRPRGSSAQPSAEQKRLYKL